MPDAAREKTDSLWVQGEMSLRINGPSQGSERCVTLRQPFARIGRAPDSSVRLSGSGVSAAHVFLLLDRRGVFAVDLSTRTCTRFNGEPRSSGWLKAGDVLEVDGTEIELSDLRIDGQPITSTRCDPSLLDHYPTSPLVDVTLNLCQGQGRSWSISSELIFIGWSSACGLRLNDRLIAKIHAALYRSEHGAYLIELGGQPTLVDGEVLRGATPIPHEARLTLGATSIQAQVLPPCSPAAQPSRALVAHVIQPEVIDDKDESSRSSSSSRELASADSQQALLAWMVQSIRRTEGVMLQRQGEMHSQLAELLRQAQRDQTLILNSYLERIERLDRELSAIREKLAEGSATSTTPPAPALPPAPQATPLQLNLKRPEPTNHQNSQASTNWLLQRVAQLENENRSAWKELLGRLTSRP